METKQPLEQKKVMRKMHSLFGGCEPSYVARLMLTCEFCMCLRH